MSRIISGIMRYFMKKNINEFSPIKQRFFMIYKSTGLTQAEFGARIGKSQRLISDILNDHRNVSADMIQLLHYKLNVNVNFLLKGETPMFLPKEIRQDMLIPLIADIPAGPWEAWIDSYAPGAGEDYVSCPELRGENLFAIRVDGDSMMPQLHPGDILVIDPHRRFTSGIAAVRHHWGYKIRNVHRAGEKLLLYPLNPAYKPEEIAPDDNTRLYVPVKVLSVRDI